MGDLKRITLEKGSLLLDSFDFAKMAAYMKINNWRWSGSNTDVTSDQLRSTAANLIVTMMHNERENSMVSTGGLLLTRFVWHNNVVELSLYGYLEHSSEQEQMVLRRTV